MVEKYNCICICQYFKYALLIHCQTASMREDGCFLLVSDSQCGTHQQDNLTGFQFKSHLATNSFPSLKIYVGKTYQLNN